MGKDESASGTSTDGCVFSMQVYHSLVCTSCFDPQHVTFFWRGGLQDKITAALVMQIWFGKWVQVMVFSLVWCVPNPLGTHSSNMLPHKYCWPLHTVFAANVKTSINLMLPAVYRDIQRVCKHCKRYDTKTYTHYQEFFFVYSRIHGPFLSQNQRRVSALQNGSFHRSCSFAHS